MKKKIIKVPIYDFTITFVEVEKEDDKCAISKLMLSHELPKELIDEVKDKIEKGCIDGGLTTTRPSSHEIFVLLYKSSNETKRRNVVNHEKRHVEDDILEITKVEGQEASAYLAGFLSEHIY